MTGRQAAGSRPRGFPFLLTAVGFLLCGAGFGLLVPGVTQVASSGVTRLSANTPAAPATHPAVTTPATG